MQNLNLLHVFISFICGYLICYFYFKVTKKLITQEDRNQLYYPAGSGTKILKSACWRIDPRRRRSDETAARKLLFDEGIDYQFFRVLSVKERLESDIMYQDYIFEYWK